MGFSKKFITLKSVVNFPRSTNVNASTIGMVKFGKILQNKLVKFYKNNININNTTIFIALFLGLPRYNSDALKVDLKCH